jgi:hypothetical protein
VPDPQHINTHVDSMNFTLTITNSAITVIYVNLLISYREIFEHFLLNNIMPIINHENANKFVTNNNEQVI